MKLFLVLALTLSSSLALAANSGYQCELTLKYSFYGVSAEDGITVSATPKKTAYILATNHTKMGAVNSLPKECREFFNKKIYIGNGEYITSKFGSGYIVNQGITLGEVPDSPLPVGVRMDEVEEICQEASRKPQLVVCEKYEEKDESKE